MEELLKRIMEGEAFLYELEDGGAGLVLADTIDEAEQKVRESYAKHGGYESGSVPGHVRLWAIDTCQRHFPDCPDVLELPIILDREW